MQDLLDIWHRRVCVRAGGRTLRHNQIFLPTRAPLVNSKHLTFCLQFDVNITISELNHLILKTCGNGIRSPGSTTSPVCRYLEVVCPVDVKRFQHMFLNKTIKTQGYVNNPPIIQISSCHFCHVKENIQFHFRSLSSLPKNVLLSTSWKYISKLINYSS